MKSGVVALMVACMVLAMTITPVFALIGDVNGDGKVRIDDVLLVINAYGSKVGDPRYDPRCDFNHDGKVLIDDVLTCVSHFGETA
jgi:hypothetical protein